MNIIKHIFLITTLVAVLSLAKSDDGPETQRIKRHDTSIRIKRTSYIPPPPVPFDYTDNADGFYVFNLKLMYPFCSYDKTYCNPDYKWSIVDFKFQLHNKKDPCHNITIELDPDKISSIQSSIDKRWHTIGGPGAANNKWKYNGSCSLRIPELDDEFKFFKKSIDLYDRFNITRILQDKGITFRSDYSIDKIRETISDALGGKQAQLGCLGGHDPLNSRRDGIDQFNEVIIFLDKQFNPINNPGWEKYIFFECSQNVIVHYGLKE